MWPTSRRLGQTASLTLNYNNNILPYTCGVKIYSVYTHSRYLPGIHDNTLVVVVDESLELGTLRIQGGPEYVDPMIFSVIGKTYSRDRYLSKLA